MNVYDFDNTIYDGDSTLDFYFFCIKKHPSIIVYLPGQLYSGIRFIIGRIDKVHFKEDFYKFFLGLSDIDNDVNIFWDQNSYKIKEWYLNSQKEDDLVISASPHFLLSEICKRISIHHLIASEVDKHTGKYNGKNCHGQEKVIRFREQFNSEIDSFFSDSSSDLPLARISEKAFLVNKNKIMEWEL